MTKKPVAIERPTPVLVPDLSALPTLTETLENVSMAELNPVALCRIRFGGDTRFNLPGVAHLCTLGRLHNVGPQFPWLMVKQGKLTGSLFLIPTDENNPDRIAAHWYDAGHDVAFTLNKVLRVRKIHISPGHALVCTCHLLNAPGIGAVLELRLGSATAEPLDHLTPEPTPEPTPGPAPEPAPATGAGEPAPTTAAPAPTARPARKRRRRSLRSAT